MPKYFFLTWYILHFRFNLAHFPHMLPGLHTYNKAENIGSVWERPNLKWVLFCVNICTNYAPNLWPNLTLGRSNTSCNIILQIALLHTFARFGSFFSGRWHLVIFMLFLPRVCEVEISTLGQLFKKWKITFSKWQSGCVKFCKKFCWKKKKTRKQTLSDSLFPLKIATE